MTGTAEFHLTVHWAHGFAFIHSIYFRKLPYFGLNILSYPWTDKQGLAHRIQLGAGESAPSPALGTAQGWPGIWGTGDQPCRGISGAGDDGPRRLKWGSGLWAGTVRAGGPLWEGSLTWGSSLRCALCSRRGSSTTSVTAYSPKTTFALMHKHGGSCWLVTQL